MTERQIAESVAAEDGREADDMCASPGIECPACGLPFDFGYRYCRFCQDENDVAPCRCTEGVPNA
jgi:hypothetical protein